MFAFSHDQLAVGGSSGAAALRPDGELFRPTHHRSARNTPLHKRTPVPAWVHTHTQTHKHLDKPVTPGVWGWDLLSVTASCHVISKEDGLGP